MLADFGSHRKIALQAIINARRQPKAESSMWERTKNFFQKKDLPRLIGTPLSSLKLQGFIPNDFIEYEIPWDAIKYSIDDCISFGFTFEHMLRMNFRPDHFKQCEWRHYRQLNIDAKEMLKTCLNIHDLIALNLTPQQLHQLKWSWADLASIGGTKENIKFTKADQQMYFKKPVTKQRVGAFKF